MSQYINTALLRKAVEWAEEEAAKPRAEREWLQAWWCIPKGTKHMLHAELREGMECGTVGCIAYHICTIEEGVEAQVTEYNRRLGVEGTPRELSMMTQPAWADRAAQYLNVPVGACTALFDGDTNIVGVRTYAEALVLKYGEPGERL